MSPEFSTTSADLMSSVSSDLFSSASPEDYGGDDAVVADVAETPEEVSAPADDVPMEGADEVPVEEEAPEEAAVEPQQEATEEELPEGVRRGKDRNGKEGLWLTPQRYDTFHGAHKLVQQTAEQWGEPITPEGLDVRNRAYQAQERMFHNLASGDPAAQADVLDFILKENATALKSGAVGVDPTLSLADAMYSTFRDSHPDAYARIRHQAAKDLIEELYQEAGNTGNENLWRSLGWVAKTLALPTRKTADFAGFAQQAADPVVALQKRNQELEAQLNGRQASNHAAQYDSWNQATSQSVRSAVLEDAVKPALTETQKAWEKFPEAYSDLVVNRLHSAVKDTIAADKNFSGRIALLDQQARRATSAQKRGEIAEHIKQAYTNRARLAVEAHKPKILADAARIFKERSDANHARRNAAPQRGPKGTSSPVPTTKADLAGVGQVGGNFTMDQAMKDMAKLFA